MPLQPSRGHFEIRFASAFALCFCVGAALATPLAAQSMSEHIASIVNGSVAAQPEGRESNFNQNLQSDLKFDRETSKNRKPRAKNLYYSPQLDTYSNDKNSGIPQFDRGTESESEATLTQLPNRGESRREISIPNPAVPTPSPLPEPAPRAPLPPPQQLLQPTAPAPPDPEQLLNLTGTITVDLFEVIGSTVFSKAELDAVLKEFTARPITFAELLQARSAVGQLYTSKGYITSGALIPPQTLTAGVVRILVLEGKLESINIAGTRRLNPNYIRSRLARATRGPLNEQRLLQALQLLQAGGQLENISAQLQAGYRPGFNVLWVRVKEAKTFQAGIFTDNSRSPSVGSWRRGVEVREGNLLGLGDSASLTYTNSQGSNGVDFSYTLPVNARNGTVSFGTGRTKSNIIEAPFDALDIEASGRSYDLTYRQPVVQTPTTEIAIGIGAGRRESDTSLLGEDFPLSSGSDSRGKTRVSALRLFQDFTQRGEKQVLAARSQFSLGAAAFGATASSNGPDSQFLAWRGQLQYVRLLAPQTLLVVRSDVQLAGGELLPLEQFGIGGPETVRGYRQDALLADSGLFATAELRYPILRTGDKKGLLQVTPFVDFGNVWNSGGRATLEANTLLSAGLGLRWQYADNWSARLGWGIPLIDLKSSDSLRDSYASRTLQERGLYFSLEFKPF